MLDPQTAAHIAFMNQEALGSVERGVIQDAGMVEELKGLAAFRFFGSTDELLNGLHHLGLVHRFDLEHRQIGQLAAIDQPVEITHLAFEGEQSVTQFAQAGGHVDHGAA